MRLIASAFCGIALVLAAPASPAAAQAQGAITVGMPVTDAAGAPVGTVKAVQGDNILVKTDKHEALLPKASFTPADGKLLFGMTQAQLDTEIEKGLAAADAAVAAGATVKGIGGVTIGTIDALDADAVTIALPSGKKVRVPRSGVRGNADGTVAIGISAEQLEAQLQSSGAASPSGR